MSIPESLARALESAKDTIRAESGKALADIDAYTAIATSNPYAANEDIQAAIEASRKAQDAISEAKSAAMIAVDNITKTL